MPTLILDPNDVADYQRFLKIKGLPYYRVRGRECTFPDEYAKHIEGTTEKVRSAGEYNPPSWMFDYQRDITTTAIAKKKYCLFIDCGYGKTAIFLEFARHALRELSPGRRPVLIVSPLMVIKQTISECAQFFSGEELTIKQIPAAGLQEWLLRGQGVGITNYEAITPELTSKRLGGLILDESSMLKSAYGKWGTKLIEMGRGVEWKMSATGTPAPNDRIEYANQAVFMDAFPTVNSFLARFFVNKGQTNERWILKPHALRPFYKALSHWSIFMTNPATYGWKDNAESIPPIHIHEHDVPMTEEQTQLAFNTHGQLFADRIGGITNRSVLAQIAKGFYKKKRIPTNKPAAIKELIEMWPEESTIIWCKYNDEQKLLEETFPDAASLQGKTPTSERMDAIDAFKSGEIKVLISKPKILGFGLNLQQATRHVFSSCEDSYEQYYQAIKRSNRVGSTRPLNVHMPMTDIERIQMENVLQKADRVHQDTIEQEALFHKESN